MVKLCVYTFSNLFDGLPAGGPFDLKLLAWLNRADIPYELRFQDDTRKAPKGKNPWIEVDGERIGDTELIIAKLSALLQVNVEAGLSAEEAAVAHAWRRTFEEHFHQIFEWELLVHPAGARFMQRNIAKQMPPLIGGLAFKMMQKSMSRQLHARGIGRHTAAVIEAKGRDDLEALSDFLGSRPYLVADKPVVADMAVFGQLAPMMVWPMHTPVAGYARKIRNLVDYCDRMRSLCFASKRSGT